MSVVMHAVDMSQLSDSKFGNCAVVKSPNVHVYVHLTHYLYMHVTCMFVDDSEHMYTDSTERG